MVIDFDRQAAIDVLNTRGWTQNQYNDKKESAPVCLHGAIRLCQQQPGDAHIIEQVWQARGYGIDWNDASSTEKDDVLEQIVTQRPIFDSELADIFGPQWREIVAFVRRVNVLTGKEIKNLIIPRHVPRTTAWGAVVNRRSALALSATREVAREASWSLVYNTNTQKIWFAQWHVIQNTAVALCARDLIGETFTQEHYDALTGSWRRVVGPLHPDDAPLA